MAVKVEGRPDLVRDEYSGAVVNTNRSAYEQAVRAAKIAKDKEDKMDSVIEDINNVKKELDEVKDLLKELLKRV
jgi:methyl-accepting chemotaxis protein